MPFDFTKSVAGQLANVSGTPDYLVDNVTGAWSWWNRWTKVLWLITTSTEAGLDSSDATISAFLRDVVGLSLGSDYMRVSLNARGATMSAQYRAQLPSLSAAALGQGRPSFGIMLYTAALSSPAGNWGGVGFFFKDSSTRALFLQTTAAELPIPTNGDGSAGSREIVTQGGAVDSVAAALFPAYTRATAAEVPDEEDEEEDVVEGSPPVQIVQPPPSNVPNDQGGNLVSVVVGDTLGEETPVVLPALRGSTGLVRFVATLPGFSARVGVPNGLTFTKNAVARAAWTVSKAILTSLGLVSIVEAIDDLADDGALNFLLGGGAGEYDVGDTIGNASVTKTWEANGVPFLALSDGRLGARKSTGMWRFWRPRRPIVLYSDGAKDLKTGIKAGKALIKQAREMRKLSNALLGTQKEKRRSAPPHQHHEVGTSIRNIEVT